VALTAASTILLVAAVVFVAAFVRSALGFGDAVVARAPEAPLVLALGAIVLLYGLSGLLRPAARIKGEKPGLTFLVGLIAGVLGGAYNTNGPPVVIFGMMRAWPAERFRATLQGYFLPTGLLIMLGHGAAGFWTGPVLRLYAFSLPAIILGVWLGDRAGRGRPENRFRRLLSISLIAMGASLILWTAFRPGNG
jgi:uncharacterized protein